MKNSIIIWTLCFGLTGTLYGQQHTLYVDQQRGQTLEDDSVSTSARVRDLLLGWINKGHIYASLDSIVQDTSNTSWYLHKGVQLAWKQVRLIEDSTEMIFKRGVPQNLLKSYASRGYPFVNFSMMDLSKDQGELRVTYKVSTGTKIYFDSISVSGDDPFRKATLYSVVGFYPGDPYNEEVYLSLAERINQLSFVSINKPPDIGFSGSGAIIYLDLKKEKTSSFDALVGLVPKGQGRQTNLIGNVDLHLANILGRASSFDFKWKAFGQGSQSLKAGIDLPYVGKLGIGLESDFIILKQDTSFTKVSGTAGIALRVSKSNRLGINYSEESNKELGALDQGNNGYSYSWYGLSLSNDYRPFPETRTRRFGYKIQVRLGDRLLSDSPDSVDSRSISWSGVVDQVWTRPIAKKGLIFLRSNAGWLQNNSGILKNEQYRLGGISSIRGFVDNQFFATKYYFNNFEHRFYLEKKSFIRGFADVGVIVEQQGSTSILTSFGIGLSIESSSGVFNLIFANGQERSSSTVNYNNLIHFGYSSTF